MAVSNRGTVIGVFTDQDEAQSAVNDLRSAGFREDQIGVAGRDWRAEDATDLSDNYSGEGAATGLAAGAGLGALWGMGILAGVLPVLGPALAGGTLAVLLSSAAAGAAAAGLAGALIGMGIEKEDADFYESEFQTGRIIVTVSAAGRESAASEILLRHGGYNRANQPQLSI